MKLALQIERESDGLVHMTMLVNGQRVSGHCGLTVRSAEAVAFIQHINPHVVAVDREMISERLLIKLRGFQNLQLS